MVGLNIAERESDQKKTFVAERKNYQMLSFIFTLISTVNENESGREVGHQRWQIESLVSDDDDAGDEGHHVLSLALPGNDDAGLV